ncbi:cold-shock DNA-binding domain protein [Nitzschia inconspicua]|uniref:Cold-shock DNA-binding domain protein n=1 Tax=Nitzschia inconspicua TaxID=303405 RepID=A0A9K3KD44_9STRA|nr:cold-shock DNA-binding domain protein [Nitzschia inconspicua]
MSNPQEEKKTNEPASIAEQTAAAAGLAAPSTQRQTGTVAKWLNHRGIGFITPDGQTSEVGKDLLVHYSHIKQGSETAYVSLREGSKVEFETAEDPKNRNKLIAVKVTAVGGGDCERKQRHHRDDRYTFNKKYNKGGTNNRHFRNNTIAGSETTGSGTPTAVVSQ